MSVFGDLLVAAEDGHLLLPKADLAIVVWDFPNDGFMQTGSVLDRLATMDETVLARPPSQTSAAPESAK